MTVTEFEEMAQGLDTGYTDRCGNHIKVGDSVLYYKKCTKAIDTRTDSIKNYPSEYVVGEGHIGYVYTGKIMRTRHTVTFNFEDGLSILSGNRWKYLYETDKKGNLLTIVIDNDHKNPKLTFEQVIGKRL